MLRDKDQRWYSARPAVDGTLPPTDGALCSGRSVILAAGLQKAVPGLKFVFLDQISSRPCQPDMTLGFILSLRIYSDGHCTKPDVSGIF